MSSVLKNTLWSILEQGGTGIIGLVVQIVLARLLAPEVFGIMAILNVVINFASVISQSGLGMSLIQKDYVDQKTCSTAFWLSMAISAVLFATILIIAPFLAMLYDMEALTLYLTVLSFSIFLSSFNAIQRAILQKEMSFRALFKINIITGIMSGFIACAVAIGGFGIWALIIYSYATGITSCIALMIKVTWKPAFVFDRLEAKELFSFGWRICVSNIFGSLSSSMAELVIGAVTSKTMLGYYSQGRRWPYTVMGMIVVGIQNVMFPAFVNIKNSAQSLAGTIRSYIVSGSYVIMPICILAAIVAEPLVVIVFSEKWLPCVPVFQLFFIGYTLTFLEIVNLRAYMAVGDSKLYMRISIIRAVGEVAVVCGTAVLTADIYYVALAACLYMNLSILAIDLLPAKRVLGIGEIEQLKLVAPVLGIAILAGVIPCYLSIFDINYFLLIILQVVIYVAVYLPCLWAFKIGDFRERIRAVWKMIHKV